MLLTKEEKIKNEKFRRDQAYSWLNYVISRITYFDFFSKDTFEMALNSKYFAQICNRTDVTSELLLLSLFETDSELTRVLRSFKISKRKVTRLVSKTNLKYEQKNNFFERHTRNFKNFFVKYEENLNKDIIFSQEVHQIFQKSSELALKRFKTPVISASILFLTILDDETLSACKILKRCLSPLFSLPLLPFSFKTLPPPLSTPSLIPSHFPLFSPLPTNTESVPEETQRWCWWANRKPEQETPYPWELTRH